MVKQNNKTSEQQSLDFGFGAKLKAAREAMNLEIHEVAERLHLTKQRVIDLENSSFGNVSSALYARGYLRAYAKLLGLNEVQVVQDAEASGLLPQTEVAIEPISATTRKLWRRPRKHLRWLNLVILILFITLTSAWWHDNGKMAQKVKHFLSVVVQVVVPSKV